MLKNFLDKVLSSQEVFQVPYLCNGELLISESDKWTDVVTRATGEAFCQVPDTTLEENEKVMASLQEGFLENRHISFEKRAQWMFKAAEKLDEHRDGLIELILRESGKIWNDAKAGIFRGEENIWFAAATPGHVLGSTLPDIASDMDLVSYREPLGVCAAIIPFNFPSMINFWSGPQALACGNSFIIKPSPHNPLSSLAFALLMLESGVPENLVGVIHGGVPSVEFICTHDDVKAIVFVGGNTAGEYVAGTGQGHGKKVICNMGASNCAVVLPDCNKDHALTNIANGAVGSQGERCMASSRILAVGECQQWKEEMAEKLSHYVCGEGHDPNADFGPLVSQESVDRIDALLTQAEKEGAKIWLDGRNVEVEEKYKNGFWMGPTLVECTPEMSIFQEEVFGPVLLWVDVENFDESIDLINSSRYGNGTALFTSDGAAARKFTSKVEVGQVGINVPIPVPIPPFSFTGSKDSFWGDSNVYGIDGAHFFTKNKTITSLWREELSAKKETSFPTTE